MASVIIYTLRSCPTCLEAKADLTAEGIDFEERQVDNNQGWWEAASKLSYTVPVILRNGKPEIGWKGRAG